VRTRRGWASRRTPWRRSLSKMGWRQYLGQWIIGSEPRPRAGLGRWPGPLVAWTILSTPLAPVVDACSSTGTGPRVSAGSWAVAAGTFVVGLVFASSGRLWDVVRRVRGQRRSRKRGDAPWFRDRNWNASQAAQTLFFHSPLPRWMWAIFIALISWGFVAAAFWPNGKPSLDLPPCVPVVVGAVLLGEVALLRPERGRWKQYVVVAWPSLPQVVGDRVTFQVGTSGRRTLTLSEARLVLRCVREERFGPLGIRRRASSVYRSELILAPEVVIGPALDVRVEFDVPADAPPTDFVGDPAVFWELAVLGYRQGGRSGRALVAEPIFVPIYRR